MPSDTVSPPPYDADAELLRALAALSVGTSAHDSPITPPRRAPHLYRFENAHGSGVTDSWAEASAETQGVPGASPQRLTPKSKRGKKSGAYAVFHGLKPGAYPLWYEEAKPLVDGVKGSIYQGYPNMELALVAYDYAHERGWTRTLPVFHLTVSTATSTMSRLPTPGNGLDFDIPNPLHNASTSRNRWYVVFCGIAPGVYQSSLECSLNTMGLSCASHQSFATKELAIAEFNKAVDNGRVRVVTPKYF
ncbi:hypothetical protein C8R47DRAFT_1230810 [Mycena vitilis]|nr:hypothetical protein C8R47DRAFT_1230810 [Mycena vitilis]